MEASVLIHLCKNRSYGMSDVAAIVDSKIIKEWGGKTRSTVLARFCPRCTYPLSSRSVGDVELDHCNRCKGNFFDPGEVGATFGVFTDPEKWVETHVPLPSGVLNCAVQRGTNTSRRSVSHLKKKRLKLMSARNARAYGSMPPRASNSGRSSVLSRMRSR